MTSPDAHAPRSASGAAYEIAAGGSTAVVAALAAGLRRFEKGGTLLTESYGDGSIAPGATGLTLAPWANRIRDGRWVLDGKTQQLDITEVARNNASHGLLRNTAYHLVSHAQDAVVLEAAIHPQHGYPFLLRHQVTYTIGADGGLRVQQTLINDGGRRAPFVLGAHPYLRIGEVPTEDLVLTVRARTRLEADQQLIPIGRRPVEGSFDLGSGAPISGLELDSAYTDLEFDGGKARATLRAPDGRRVWLWQGTSCPYTHVFVTRTFPGRPVAVALEPMSGPADAFNSGDGLGWLEPGASHTIRWGIDAEV